MNATDLTPHRIQLHYAIQFIAAVGMSLGDSQPDGSQMTLTWDPELNAFVGLQVPGTSIQIALLPTTLTSLILVQHQPVAELSLAGQTMATALAWHRQELAKLGVANPDRITLLTYPADDFPAHPLAEGAAFEEGSAAARSDVAYYYALTQPILDRVTATYPEASPIRIWPHHFDMATLLTYAGVTEAETKYLGVGLSPGDGSYAEPYWYISPYPAPDQAVLPELPIPGVWHTDHWVGAVLTASRLTDRADLESFVSASVAISQLLLGV